MDNITGYAPAPRQINNASGANQSPSGSMMGTNMSSDFETFLRMLTVQMQNQDPLNPIEATDYAVQLATFSTLEQQALTNKILQSMLPASQDETPMMALNDWVGLDVTSERKFYFSGEDIAFQMPDLSNSQDAHLVIKNEKGNIIDVIEIDSNDKAVKWNNEEFKDGTYSAEFKVFEDGVLLVTKPALISGEVLQARWRNGQIELLFEGDISISAQAVVTAAAGTTEKH